LETITILEGLTGRRMLYRFAEWRPGDQRVFVCDLSKAQATFGWKPRVSPSAGVRKLYEWVVENQALFASSGAA
jgi:CDP-paratose 2-epimerase